MRKILLALVISVAALCLAGCASMEWVSSLKPAQIARLSGARAIGVVVLPVKTLESTGWAVKILGDFYTPTEIPEIPYKVAMIYASPAAVTELAVTKDTLASLWRDAAAQLIGGETDFDAAFPRGFGSVRLMSQSLTGEKAPRAYDTVVPITDAVPPSLTAEAITSIGAAYGVDAVLALQPTVYGEIGMVLTFATEKDMSGAVKPGDFFLRSKVSMSYVLFDGKSGAVITDSTATPAPYAPREAKRAVITKLPVTDVAGLKAFAASGAYPALWKDRFQEVLIPSLPLFRPVYVGVMEAVQK
jgi:hypothetical protein